MLAALAREDLCLVQTQISVRIEIRRRGDALIEECINPLPSNEGREWVVRLAPSGNSEESDPREVENETLTMLTVILREASLLPETDFSASLERAFERGLGHKLSPGRPYDELAAAFAKDIEPSIHRSPVQHPLGLSRWVV